MKAASVSFGKVIAVSGKDAKIKKMNSKLANVIDSKHVIVRDYTSFYQNAPSAGSLAQAAQRGDKIEIYVTGGDVKKMGKFPDWKTPEGVLSHLSSCYDLAKTSINEVVEKIIRG